MNCAVEPVELLVETCELYRFDDGTCVIRNLKSGHVVGIIEPRPVKDELPLTKSVNPVTAIIMFWCGVAAVALLTGAAIGKLS